MNTFLNKEEYSIEIRVLIRHYNLLKHIYDDTGIRIIKIHTWGNPGISYISLKDKTSNYAVNFSSMYLTNEFITYQKSNINNKYTLSYILHYTYNVPTNILVLTAIGTYCHTLTKEHVFKQNKELVIIINNATKFTSSVKAVNYYDSTHN